MVIDIKKVLVADAVDKVCVDILKNNGIIVDCKYKQSKQQLIDDIKVSIHIYSDCNIVCHNCVTIYHAIYCIIFRLYIISLYKRPAFKRVGNAITKNQSFTNF